VKWLLDVSDTTVVDWGMHADVENPASAFSLANCGTFTAGPGNACGATAGTGWMSASAFRDGIERHEVGAINSHQAKYASEMSRVDLNVRLKAEPLVGPPSMNLGTFAAQVESILHGFETQIGTAIGSYEPCGPLCDSTCTDSIGNPNLIPYAACPVPRPSELRLFSPIPLFVPRGGWR
jgi:hypothetical protein